MRSLACDQISEVNLDELLANIYSGKIKMTKVENLNHYYQVHVNHLLSTRLDTDISKEFLIKLFFMEQLIILYRLL